METTNLGFNVLHHYKRRASRRSPPARRFPTGLWSSDYLAVQRDRGFFERNKFMSWTSDPPSCSPLELGTRASQRARGLTAFALAALLGGACTGSVEPGGTHGGS